MPQHQRTFLLLPLAAFLLVFFVAPLAWLLSLAVREAEVPRALPRTLAALQGWQHPQPLPAPLWGAVAMPRSAWWRGSVLALCLIGQWWWIFNMYALGNTYWQIP